jgi:hypothetical protein
MPPQHACLKKRRVVGPNPRPAQALNNHNSALLPKRHFRRAAANGSPRPRGRKPNRRRRSKTGACADQCAAAGATKSAGSESAARHDRVTPPIGRAKGLRRTSIARLIVTGRSPVPNFKAGATAPTWRSQPPLRAKPGCRRRHSDNRRAARSAVPWPRRRARRPGDETAENQPKTSRWSRLHALGGASKLPANVNDRSGASGGA